jgi:O-methyltransferase
MKLFNKIQKNLIEDHQNIPNQIVNQIINQRGNINDIFPADFSETEKEAIIAVEKYTMTSIERLVSLYRSIIYLEENGIEGSIVECGVWKGGCMMLVARALLKMGNRNRHLYLFDTYEGMSEPTDNDSTFEMVKANDLLNSEKNKFDGNNIWCYSSITEVQMNMLSTRYDEDKISLVKGKVETTLPHEGMDKIALLRLDTDWYESTKHEMETLYDKLVIGGVLIIDDYGHWNGARKAIDDFITKRKLKIFLNRVDYTGRLAIKTF